MRSINVKAKIQDFAAHWLLSLVLVGFILFQHYWSIAHVPPVLDGSNHVATIGNYGLLINWGEWGKLASELMAEGNNFLSDLYFSLFSAAIGPGRIAWGWAWGSAILISTFLGLKICRDEKLSYVLAFALMILSSTLVDRDGGILDQRLDGFSVLILILMASALIKELWTFAAFLSFFAVMAKGVALPLTLLAWGAAAITGMIHWKGLFGEIRRRRLSWMALVVLIFGYAWIWLRPVIAYNLLALHSGSDSHGPSFLKTVSLGLANGSHYYTEKIAHRNFLCFVLPVVSILFSFLNRLKNPRQWRIARWGLVYLLGTFCIFSAHPVLSLVLWIWLTPCFFIMAFSLTSVFETKWRTYDLALSFLCALLCGAFISFQNYGRHLYDLDSDQTDKWHHILISSHEISDLIASWQSRQPMGSHAEVIFYPNFLYWISGYLELNYDAFRVMTFENLGNKSPLLKGWELGTHSENWKSELDSNKVNTPAIVILFTDEKVKLFPGRPIGLISGLVKSEMDSLTCKPEPISDLQLEGIGRFLVYTTNGTMNRCGFPN